jgi:hypothetical protein
MERRTHVACTALAFVRHHAENLKWLDTSRRPGLSFLDCRLRRPKVYRRDNRKSTSKSSQNDEREPPRVFLGGHGW